MKLDLKTKERVKKMTDAGRVIKLNSGRVITLNLGTASFDFKLENDSRVLIFGELFYYIIGNGELKLIDAGSTKLLQKEFADLSLKEIIPRLEGQYVGVLVDAKGESAQIFSDRYARLDCFYSQEMNKIHFSSDLDVIFQNVKPVYDQRMLAHLFQVYGWYTPKGLTIYENVQQLRVGEIITFKGSEFNSEIIEFKPLKIENYADEDLETYFKLLKESIFARANRTGTTWVSSSSGWDSSILLGMLVDQFGPEKVRMLTGSMQYSEGTKTINQFEIDKINKIGDFYGIKPEIVNLDYKNKAAVEYWKERLPFYRSRHIYSITSFNFSRISDGFLKVTGSGQTVFNGETSDSFHNLGFSQFVTFFHTQKPFTEYGDKMNCYLYGPSFLKKVLDNSYASESNFTPLKSYVRRRLNNHSSPTFPNPGNRMLNILHNITKMIYSTTPRDMPIYRRISLCPQDLDHHPLHGFNKSIINLLAIIPPRPFEQKGTRQSQIFLQRRR